MKVLIVGGEIGGMTTALSPVSKPRCSSRPGIRKVGIGINALPRAVNRDDGRTLYGAPVGGGS